MPSMREILEQNFDAVENDEATPVIEESIEEPEIDPIEVEAEEEDSQRVRDEKGRFASKEPGEQGQVSQEAVEGSQEQVAPELVVDELTQQMLAQKPQSFKRADLWQKAVDGSLEPKDQRDLAKYYVEREHQFLKGIGQYKQAAEKSNYLAAHLEPFVPGLQAQGIDPGEFVGRLANAHFKLTNGTPTEKAQIFQELAANYGVNVNYTDQGAQMAPMDPMLHQKLSHYEREISAMKQWRENQSSAIIHSEIEKLVSDTNNFPHFNDLREDMAQLLESGQARTFEDAYKRAVRLNDNVWAREEERLLAQKLQGRSTPQPVRQIQKAKAIAVSPKSGGPRTTVSKPSNSNSIRDSLESAFGEHHF